MSRYRKFADHPVIPDPTAFGFGRDGGFYTPSPTEIREQCQLIQQTWSIAERADRSGGADRVVEVLALTPVTPGRK